MAYITSVERIGMEKGLEQGLARGRTALASALTRVLAKRFGPVPAWARKKIEGADYSHLEARFDVCLDESTLEEILD